MWKKIPAPDSFLSVFILLPIEMCGIHSCATKHDPMPHVCQEQLILLLATLFVFLMLPEIKDNP